MLQMRILFHLHEIAFDTVKEMDTKSIKQLIQAKNSTFKMKVLFAY